MGRYRNGLYDPPQMDPIFSGDPTGTPPLYTYPVMFPSGDPTGTPAPPFSTAPPALKPLGPAPVPKGSVTGNSGLLLIAAAVGLILLVRKR